MLSGVTGCEGNLLADKRTTGATQTRGTQEQSDGKNSYFLRPRPPLAKGIDLELRGHGLIADSLL